MLVVHVRKRTVQTQKVQVNGIRLLGLHPLGPHTHGCFFMGRDTSCPDKFFFEKCRGRGGRQAPWDKLFQASCPHHGCRGVEGMGTFLLWGKHPYSLKTGQGLLCYEGSEFRRVFFPRTVSQPLGEAPPFRMGLHSIVGRGTTDPGSGKPSLSSGILHGGSGFARQLSLFFETGVIC